jgi:predicted transcriptional regulator
MKVLIKKAMADAGINSNKELSRISGVSYDTIADIMRGKNPNTKTVSKLLDAMGFRLTYTEK